MSLQAAAMISQAQRLEHRARWADGPARSQDLDRARRLRGEAARLVLGNRPPRPPQRLADARRAQAEKVRAEAGNYESYCSMAAAGVPERGLIELFGAEQIALFRRMVLPEAA